MAKTATLARALVALNGAVGPNWAEAETATIYPCTLITKGSSTKKVILCGTAAKPTGVADCDDDKDMNTVYAIGESVPYWKLGSGVTIHVLYEDGSNSLTLYQEDTMIASNNESGACEKWSYTGKSLVYSSAEFTERGDAPLNYRIGKIAREITLSAQGFVTVDLI